MHEYGLMEAVVERALEESRARGGLAVDRVRIEVGAFALASPESLGTAFEILSRGTALEGAALEIRQTPGRAACEACGFSGTPEDLGLADEPPVPLLCPSCGRPLVVVAGAGVSLAELQLRGRGGPGPRDPAGGGR